MYESVGDAKALALINRLFKLLDQKVKASGGVVVKTLGDGMVCEFQDPESAFRAACDMQDAAAELDVEDHPLLKIKIGYTYGPVVIEDRDVFGDTVNLCARLVSLANPSQVLTTMQTVEALPADLRARCRELYATKVRGRAGPVRVCEVMWRSDADLTKVDLSQPELSRAGEWILKLTYEGNSFIVEPTGSLRLGRDQSNDVVVPSEHASRMHARVFSRNDHFVIRDQSSNGTFVMVDGNTREVRLRREEAVLGERGWIGLGKTAAKHGDHVLRYLLERRLL
jgi:adenylate cyclase